MVSYDLLMLIVLLGSIVFGAWKGVAWQIASLSSLVASYFVALNFSPQLAPMLGEEGPWNRVVAMLILYIVTAIAIWMAFRVIHQMIDRVKLREFDRQLGAIFGGCKGVLMCLVITFFAVSLSNAAQDMVRRSKSGKYMATFMDHAHPLIPHDVHDVLHPYFEQLRQGIDPSGDNLHDHHGDAPGKTASDPADDWHEEDAHDDNAPRSADARNRTTTTGGSSRSLDPIGWPWDNEPGSPSKTEPTRPPINETIDGVRSILDGIRGLGAPSRLKEPSRTSNDNAGPGPSDLRTESEAAKRTKQLIFTSDDT